MPEWSRYFSGDSAFEIYKEIFNEIPIHDAHTHLGKDIDGSTMTEKRLLNMMNKFGIEIASIFPFNDPRTSSNFKLPNSLIRRAYNRNKKRFVPFFRLNPNQEWKKEYKRRVGQGFLGLKLHPRSQVFGITSQNVMRIYEQAEKDDLVIMMHTGFGLVDVADKILEVSKKFSKLKIILGHAAFVDIEEAIAKLSNRNNIYFDTSVSRLFDLYELLDSVKSDKIVFGSDTPYFDPEYALESLIHTSVMLNISTNNLEKIFSKNIQKWFS